MKRIFALIISLALVACLFAACGDDETYRQPGNGTTLGSNITTEPIADGDNGSYSADPNGEVSQTTDDNILEDGLDDVEDGINQGLDDIEDGIDDMTDGDMGRNNGTNGVNGTNGANGANGTNGANGEGMQSNGMNGQNDGAAAGGSTNGNSH